MEKLQKKSGLSQRQLKVGELLRHALSHIVMHSKPKDPDLLEVNVTIMEVRVTPDLKLATVYVMPFVYKNSPELLIDALNRAAPYYRRQISAEVKLRFIPVLRFVLDQSLEYAKHIDMLLKKSLTKQSTHKDPDENDPKIF
ncbi:MAG: 30S ribosome-binding factor RbfA [Alphaproteobacteria bacterium]|nr:30S ribosome-binding factor RbfA [Alphaproteobacteria bacterium]